MSELKRCFITYETHGMGIPGDPVREVTCFYDYETLAIVHVWDEWKEITLEQRLRSAHSVIEKAGLSNAQ